MNLAQKVVAAQNKPGVSVGGAKLSTLNQAVELVAAEPPQPGGDRSVWAVSIIGGLDVQTGPGLSHKDWTVLILDSATGQGVASLAGVGPSEAPNWPQLVDQAA